MDKKAVIFFAPFPKYSILYCGVSYTYNELDFDLPYTTKHILPYSKEEIYSLELGLLNHVNNMNNINNKTTRQGKKTSRQHDVFSPVEPPGSF